MAALLTSLAKSLKAESKYNNGNRTESTGIRRNPDVGGLFVMENNVVLESMIICEFETKQ